jgi:hypothetical protein
MENEGKQFIGAVYWYVKQACVSEAIIKIFTSYKVAFFMHIQNVQLIR